MDPERFIFEMTDLQESLQREMLELEQQESSKQELERERAKICVKYRALFKEFSMRLLEAHERGRL